MKGMTIALALAAFGGVAQTANAQCCDDGPRIRIEFRRERPGWHWERRAVTRCENVCVGYEDVWVTKNVTEYENRTVTRRIFVGYDCCGYPIYECRSFCERVPVCRTIRVCEKRPIYETREIVTYEWVKVPNGCGCED